MILLPHLYIMAAEEAVRLKLLIGYINGNLSERRRIKHPMPKAKAAGLSLERIDRLAIHFADKLVDELKLDYSNLDAVFSPLPWTDPGKVVELSDELVLQLRAIVV